MTRRMADERFRKNQWDRRYEPQVLAVNTLCDDLGAEIKRREGSEYKVPYVAPHYNAASASILVLSSNPGPRTGGEKGSGFLSLENNDSSAARMCWVFETVGLSTAHALPWNAYPWYVHDKLPNGLPGDLIAAGLDPLKRLLDLHPDIRAVVAHGGDAHKSMKKFRSKKHFGGYAEERGLKVFETRHTGDRAFILPPAERVLALENMRNTYREAMEYAGLSPLSPAADAPPSTVSGTELRESAREELAVAVTKARREAAQEFAQSLTTQEQQALLVELLSEDTTDAHPHQRTPPDWDAGRRQLWEKMTTFRALVT